MFDRKDRKIDLVQIQSRNFVRQKDRNFVRKKDRKFDRKDRKINPKNRIMGFLLC